MIKAHTFLHILRMVGWLDGWTFLHNLHVAQSDYCWVLSYSGWGNLPVFLIIFLIDIVSFVLLLFPVFEPRFSWLIHTCLSEVITYLVGYNYSTVFSSHLTVCTINQGFQLFTLCSWFLNFVSIWIHWQCKSILRNYLHLLLSCNPDLDKAGIEKWMNGYTVILHQSAHIHSTLFTEVI